MRVRELILFLHRWLGLVAALALLAIGLSAALLIFERPIDRLLNGSQVKVTPSGVPLSLNEIGGRLSQSYPQYRVVIWNLPQRPDEAATVDLELEPDAKPATSLPEGLELAVNPYTGEVLGDTEKRSRLMARVHQFHTHFLAGPVGSAIVGWSAVGLLILNLTGIILWWRRKIGSFRWQLTGASFYFRLHQAVGIYAWGFLMVLSLTGIAIHWGREVGRVVDRLTGSPPQVEAKMLPADSVPQNQVARPLEPDQLVSIAEKNAPGAKVTVIQMAAEPQKPVRVIMKYPEDHTPAGRTQVYLDAYSGKVRMLVDTRKASLGFKLMRLWNRQVHTGDIFGWPTQALALVFSLALSVMAITGPMLWYKRKRTSEAAQAAAADD